MYAMRLVLVLFIILAVVVAYNPQAREQAVKTWERIRPTVAGVTNSLYVAIWNLVTGGGSGDRMHQKPMPGGNFQRIVTLKASFAL